jgi:hypothetical protein
VLVVCTVLYRLDLNITPWPIMYTLPSWILSHATACCLLF